MLRFDLISLAARIKDGESPEKGHSSLTECPSAVFFSELKNMLVLALGAISERPDGLRESKESKIHFKVSCFSN